ncbi:ATP-dependent nuclease [Lactiplantibacillus plantarum]|uniref:ATP-dependent nuclease n=1 Tax=Lactiplantibacillus plantarum TaxID=1590 RepID=UPI001E3AFD28|nr:AAA family ATPase [Lactiplantibacillus plantarum]MCC6114521.1 AAA family ATPase [Lactiplantibacillus plantarum]MCW6131144.1 AAA family ATPase [Lactiplantibacillus plantarum]
MKLLKLCISNFRMLDGMELSFNENGNYIVGKNNIGKTSTLDLINTILSGKNFYESDFLNNQEPILVRATIYLSNSEVGFFKDDFSESEDNQITIDFKQADPDSQIIITSKTTGDQISKKQIQSTNYIGFSSSQKPIRENDLTQQTGNYKLIPYLTKRFLSNRNIDDISQTQTDKEVTKYINTWLMKIKPFKSNNVTVGLEANYLDYITRTLRVQGPLGIDFSKMGFGIQFSSLIPLAILDQIIYWSRYGHLAEHLSMINEDTYELHIILGLDEPEVHLHPNLQLSVMKDIEILLSGNDEGFNALLKEMFNISKIKGQLIIVTHSPYILSDDYHKYIRYGVFNDQLKITSGNDVKLNMRQKKQLEMRLPYIKNSLFSDGVILVEGETEESALPIFAERLGLSLVSHNVDIVKSGGVKNIPPLQELFETLGINNYAVIDNDGKNRGYQRTNVTKERDFEYECLKFMNLKNVNDYLSEFEEYINENDYDGSFWDQFFDQSFKENRISKICKGENICKFIESYVEGIDADEIKKIKDNVLEKLIGKKYFKNKSILNGTIIAKYVSNVPDVYSKTLLESVK